MKRAGWGSRDVYDANEAGGGNDTRGNDVVRRLRDGSQYITRPHGRLGVVLKQAQPCLRLRLQANAGESGHFLRHMAQVVSCRPHAAAGQPLQHVGGEGIAAVLRGTERRHGGAGVVTEVSLDIKWEGMRERERAAGKEPPASRKPIVGRKVRAGDQRLPKIATAGMVLAPQRR